MYKVPFIEEFFCNWSGPGHTNRPKHFLSQAKCMTQDSTGRYTPDRSHIAFSPQNDCQMAGGDDFILKANFTNDFVSAVTEHELLPIVSSFGPGQSEQNAVLETTLLSPVLPEPF